MAGFDSTSNTIAFALHLLANEMEIQERAYEEIMREIGDAVIPIHNVTIISMFDYNTVNLFNLANYQCRGKQKIEVC